MIDEFAFNYHRKRGVFARQVDRKIGPFLQMRSVEAERFLAARYRRNQLGPERIGSPEAVEA